MDARSRLLTTLAVAALTLLAAEGATRLWRGTATLPYTPGVRAYRAFDAEVDELGAAPVSIVGSSRSREALLVPPLAEAWGLPAGPGGVANYSMAGSQAADVEVVVRRLLGADPPPRLLVYGMSARQLQAGDDRLEGKGQFLWRLSDWWRVRGELGSDADRLLPAALKNELAAQSVLFSFRGELVDALQDKDPGALPKAWARLWAPPSTKAHPMRGTLPPWQQGRNRNASRKVSDAHVKKYVGTRFDIPGWPDTWQVPHLRALVDVAQAAGVTVIFVEVPLNDRLRRQLPPGTEEGFRRVVREVAAAHGVRFLEADSLGLTFEDADYREQSHMNLRGAERFSRAVASALRPDVEHALGRSAPREGAPADPP